MAMQWIGATCCAAVIGAVPAAQAQPAPEPKWGPYIDLEAKPGSKRDVGEANLFVPLTQTERTRVFGDLRARFDGGSSREGNLGLGVRHMLESGWNLGGYGYVDRRRTETGHFFNQTTLGAEALGRDWDFRGNVYLPSGSRVRDLGSTGGGATTAAVVGNTVQITTPGLTTREERALKGHDAEVGWRAPLFNAEDHRQLRVFLGGYRFSDAGISVSGPRVRAEFAMAEVPGLWKGARLALGAEFQRDDARGRQAFVSLRLRIPLGSGGARAASLNLQERRMTEPVVRDIDIVTQSRVSSSTPDLVETASVTAGGQALSVISSDTVTGAALPGAVAAAGANSVVILSGTFNTNAITTLQIGQTLMGAGTLTVRAPSGHTATLTTPGATITGAVAGNNPAVAMANNSTLTGMTVSNLSTGGGTPNPFAVRANNVTGATISNNRLTGIENLVGGTAQALLISGASSNITVSGNTLSATGTGIAVGLNVVNSTGILVTGNTMSAVGSSAGNSRAIVVNNGSFAAGSNGNTILTGICSVSVAGTGSVGLTGGGTCP